MLPTLLTMSIVYEKTGTGWILDHQKFINSDVETVVVDTDVDSRKMYTALPDLFNIINKFMMDSEFEAVKLRKAASHAGGETGEKALIGNKRIRKRKRKSSYNEGELSALAYDSQVREIIEKAHQEFVCAAKDFGIFMDLFRESIQDNNLEAREAARTLGSGSKLSEFCNPLNISGNDDLVHGSLVGGNGKEVCAQFTHLNETYFLPARSHFILSDISLLDKLTTDETKYDVIVIDPPWENKSAKRLKSYYMMRNSDFLDLPVPRLARHGCLIFVWVTNKQKEHIFVKEEMFPKWNIKFITQWFWLKVTKYGEMVYDINSEHKKPYEVVLVGQFIQPDLGDPPQLDVPLEQTIISVPCSIHSRKPPLTDILKNFTSSDARYLELFARNLLRGWTSWGNEVLKYQHVDFFEEIGAS